DKLLASLEAADHGGRDLDIIVTFALGETSTEGGRMIQILVEEGYPWDVISELLDEDLPPYTTALDAAIPGERIVLSACSRKRKRWIAAHETPDGRKVLAWAADECLARRLAALRALGPGAGAARAAPETPGAAPAPWTPPAPATCPRPPARPAETRPSSDTEEEWKILF
ncbi:MAG: hypothetical protein ACE5DS_04165, partial [Kiloniellaceae bacterium]